MIVIIIVASCRKEFSKTGSSTIIKNVVYQNQNFVLVCLLLKNEKSRRVAESRPVCVGL